MKFSTMMTVLAVALCVAGCKYNKASKGSGADGDNAGGGSFRSDDQADDADGSPHISNHQAA